MRIILQILQTPESQLRDQPLAPTPDSILILNHFYAQITSSMESNIKIQKHTAVLIYNKKFSGTNGLLVCEYGFILHRFNVGQLGQSEGLRALTLFQNSSMLETVFAIALCSEL